MRHRLIAVIRCTLPLLFAFPLLPLRAQTSLPNHPQPQQSLPDAPSAQRPLPEHPKPQVSAGETQAEPRVDEAWPRKASRGDETISMYQPQVEAWEGDEVRAYAALALVSKTNKTTKYGVVWFTAVVIATVFAAVFRLLVKRGTDVLVALLLTLLAMSASTIH